MAGAAGLEPVTSTVTGWHSNQLSYAPAPNQQFYRVYNLSRLCCFANFKPVFFVIFQLKNISVVTNQLYQVISGSFCDNSCDRNVPGHLSDKTFPKNAVFVRIQLFPALRAEDWFGAETF